VKALFATRVKQITNEEVVVENGAGERKLPARRVFALTGYHPDFAFIEKLGVRLIRKAAGRRWMRIRWRAMCRASTLAGVVIGGRYTGEIFIENGRFHGKQIIQALKA